MQVQKMDIRGQVCPSSLLLVLREVNQQHQRLMSGQLNLVVLTDNRDATGTVPDAVKNMGLDAVVEKIDGCYQITITNANHEALQTGQWK